MVLSKTLVIGRKGFYIFHLGMLNMVLPIKLSIKEMEILSSFMFHSGCKNLFIFDLPIKKLVKASLSLSSAGLCNYLKSLKSKGFILGDNNLSLSPILFPIFGNSFGYNFKLRIDE